MQITEIPDSMGLNYNKYKHRASAGVTAIGPAVRKKNDTYGEKQTRPTVCARKPGWKAVGGFFITSFLSAKDTSVLLKTHSAADTTD